MGRITAQEYQIQNTYVEAQVPAEDQQFLRGQRSESFETQEMLKSRQFDLIDARTPSPFMHPAPDPTNHGNMLMMNMLPPPGGCADFSNSGGNLPIAFGDFSPDFGEITGFAEDQSGYGAGMTYDPNSGMYMPYDWSNGMMQYGGNEWGGSYPSMMGGPSLDGGVDQFGNCIGMMENGGIDQTQSLLAALGNKLAQDRDDSLGQPGLESCREGATDFHDASVISYGEVIGQVSDCMDSGALGMGGDMCEMQNNEWNTAEMQVQQGGAGGRKNRNRERGERGGRGAGVQDVQIVPQNEAVQLEAPQHGHVNFTTVMFRNIPNKYTREMLVKQLEQELKGHFDFVYLPIDFKNQCNVGYAFINFRSVEACDIFMQNFNGVEVRKCLPGLNSRKVTEVTPARVQGFDGNVQRLRNSPVMRELSYHPEWMPLIFDENGVQMLFPQPERPLEPIKPRRRAREDIMAEAGA